VKKVFDKRNLKLFERLLENQGVSLKKDNTLNEVSLSKRLSSFKQAVVGSTGEDAWKDAWDIASSGMSDPEAEKQLYQAAAEWWHSTGKLKKEETSVEKNISFINRFLGSADLDNETEARLARLARKVDIDKLSPEAKKNLIAALQGATQDGEMDDKEEKDITQAVAKEVPAADAEPAAQEPAAQEPELKLSLKNDSVDLAGILTYFDNHPRVSDEQFKGMKKYFQKFVKTIPHLKAPNISEKVQGPVPTIKPNAKPKRKPTGKPSKDKAVAASAAAQRNIEKNSALKSDMRALGTDVQVIGSALVKVLNMIPNKQVPKAEKKKAIKVAAGLFGGLGVEKRAKQIPAPLTTDTGPVKNLVDTMSSLKIPNDIINKVFDALENQLQGKAEVHEAINKKRKVVIRYGKSKAKKKKS
jgi:hypothetical protein